MHFVESPRSIDEIAETRRRLVGKRVSNLASSEKTPILFVDDVARWASGSCWFPTSPHSQRLRR